MSNPYSAISFTPVSFLHRLFFGSMACTLLMSASFAVTMGQVDDFEDGTTQNWGTPGSTVTSNLADAGPTGTGDHALNAATGARAVIFNQGQQWSGDWVAENILSIRLDVRSLDDNGLTLWLGLSKGPPSGGGGGDTFVTSTSQSVPGDGEWHSVSFPVTAADFTNFNGVHVEKALMEVTQFRILHNPSQSFLGSFGIAGFQLDNITAVPEPDSLALLSAICVGLIFTRDRSR